MMSTVYDPTASSTNNSNSNNNTPQTSYKVTKPSSSSSSQPFNGKGTTHKIRQQLNFTDEKRWKQFSSRRLELIDKFGLSERKASEQDGNIRQIATILIDEFNYSMSAINEFEKLVTAAVQSVRRNRKRSKKRYESAMSSKMNSSSSSSSFSTSSSVSVSVSNSNSNSNSSSTSSSPIQQNNELFTSTNQLPLPPLSSISQQQQQNNNSGLKSPLLSPHNSNDQNNKIVSLPVATKNNTLPHMHTPPQAPIQTQTNPTILPPVQDQYIMTIRSLCFELINIKLQSMDKFNTTINIHNKVPNFLLDKIIHKVQNSRTFISFINQNWKDTEILKTIESSLKNLETLGEMSTKASISFVIEKYFQDQNNNHNEDKFSIAFQRQLAMILFNQLYNFESIPTYNQLKFFYFIIGTIVKDYGFDSTLYPLNEVIHHLIQNNKNHPTFMPPKQTTTTTTTTTTNNTVLPPLNNGLNILSVVSSQVENNTTNLAPTTTTNNNTSSNQEKLLSVNMLMNNNNVSTTATTTPTTTVSATDSTQTTATPLLNLIKKESFANGTLPQPIHQIL